MALNWREQLGVTSDIITNVLDTRYKNLVLIFGPPGGPRRSKRQGVTHSCVSSLWRGVRASFRASFSGSRFGFGALSVAACCSPCGWIGRAPWLRAFPFHELQRFSPSPFPTRISTCSQTLGGKFYHPWGAAAKRKKKQKMFKKRSAFADRLAVRENGPLCSFPSMGSRIQDRNMVRKCEPSFCKAVPKKTAKFRENRVRNKRDFFVLRNKFPNRPRLYKGIAICSASASLLVFYIATCA